VLQGIPTSHFPYSQATSSFQCVLVRLKSTGYGTFPRPPPYFIINFSFFPQLFGFFTFILIFFPLFPFFYTCFPFKGSASTRGGTRGVRVGSVYVVYLYSSPLHFIPFLFPFQHFHRSGKLIYVVSLHKLMASIAKVGSNFKFLEIYVAINESHATR
jgi:hypothetical protein